VQIIGNAFGGLLLGNFGAQFLEELSQLDGLKNIPDQKNVITSKAGEQQLVILGRVGRI
jgi:hypothetical protein